MFKLVGLRHGVLRGANVRVSVVQADWLTITKENHSGIGKS